MVEPFRVVFFGTSEFAVPLLEDLAAMPTTQLLAVVTQPDRPSGRGRKVGEPPVKAAGLRLGVQVLQPERVRSQAFIGELKALQPHFLVVASYGKILPEAALEVPRLAPLNVHPSLLPLYRGAAPVQRALLDGVEETGVTIMWMNERMDEGDIVLQAPLSVLPSDNCGSLTVRLAQHASALLREVLARFADGTVTRTPQDSSRATYAPPILPGDAVIAWSEPAVRCHNRVRAMAPRPGAVTALRGRRLKVLETAIPPVSGPAHPPGTIVDVTRETVRVATGKGCLDLLVVQPEASRVMTAAEWCRGARVRVGDVLESHVP